METSTQNKPQPPVTISGLPGKSIPIAASVLGFSTQPHPACHRVETGDQVQSFKLLVEVMVAAAFEIPCFPGSGSWRLTMQTSDSDDSDATPDVIPQLMAKFRTYAEYAMSGALARQYPELADSPVGIRLQHFAPLNDAVAQVLRQWAGRLSGAKIAVCSHRLYWNPVRSL